MLSKHPLDLPVGRKLSKEEVADALRLSIIAELDAISLYLQLARSIDDENVRRVFEDIAREEKTHVGEFLAVLRTLDPEQVEELKAGAQEVAELTGVAVQDPPANQEPLSEEEWRYLRSQVLSAADSVRVFRRHLPLTRVGRGVLYVPVEKPGEGVSLLQLAEISQKFRISQSAIDYARASRQPLELGDALRAAIELGLSEDRTVLKALEGLKGAHRLSISDWAKPGQAVEEVSAAVAKLLESNATPPFVLFVSPTRYARLLAVHERTGVMELTRLKALAEVVANPAVPDDTAILASATTRTIDLVLGADTEVEYLGPEDGSHTFRVWETVAVRVRYDRGIAILKQV
ncbi:MAG: family 1 encapsulin nanocompartment shell protein [Thermofilaceae archaeon]